MVDHWADLPLQARYAIFFLIALPGLFLSFWWRRRQARRSVHAWLRAHDFDGPGSPGYEEALGWLRWPVPVRVVTRANPARDLVRLHFRVGNPALGGVFGDAIECVQREPLS